MPQPVAAAAAPSPHRSVTPPPVTATGAATAAVAACGAYLLASWAWDKWRGGPKEESGSSDGEGREVTDDGPPSSRAVRPPRDARRRRRDRSEILSRCRSEARGAMADLLPALRSAVESRTDFAPEASELRR
eukprot:CAMPEP_0183312300 /NCGR_PEP_ID=MMETSP0160_2-20130417/41168_1 /TAXON_ID=2839 ORGANISM="Odontella Sinensis, Strain Grunow 1884" /NCGR_SAMPLE_ID=MMETSP0160_2 /ASSEMBLY_ACC=CAM_ASM_000250 /LENGTH=131 /DNA_ID=CAMNT_0025477133 /DNA_START=51 /DNA_END=443 /DNA_ORIENTATION=+